MGTDVMANRHFRDDITAEKIRELEESGMTRKEIATYFGVHHYTILMELRGERKHPVSPRKNRKKMCRCCGVSPVAPTNYFLCGVCFRTKDSTIHEEHKRCI